MLSLESALALNCVGDGINLPSDPFKILCKRLLRSNQVQVLLQALAHHIDEGPLCILPKQTSPQLYDCQAKTGRVKTRKSLVFIWVQGIISLLDDTACPMQYAAFVTYLSWDVSTRKVEDYSGL